MQYSGGLTTPPCQEGFLWHVFGTPMNIGRKQVGHGRRSAPLKRCCKGGEWDGTSGIMHSIGTPI